jgi:hypothetical protein
MTTVTVFSSMNKVCAPNSPKPIYFTEDWYIQLQRGKVRQKIPKQSGKIFTFRHDGALRFRFMFQTPTLTIQVYWECEKESTRIFLLNVTCDSREETLQLE